MSLSALAKKLGKRGGLARAKKLSTKRRKEIASLGGRTKALSAKAVQRIEDNLIYLNTLQGMIKTPRIKSMSYLPRKPLPGIYAKHRSN